MDDDAILTLQQVAALPRIGRRTAYTMVQRGKLPAFRVRGQWRCRRADLDEWIAKQVAGPERKANQVANGTTKQVAGPERKANQVANGTTKQVAGPERKANQVANGTTAIDDTGPVKRGENPGGR
jgi:excisionase family DNA binding protein